MERVRRNVRFMLADFIDFLVGVDPRCLSVLSLSFFLSVMCVRVCMYVCVCVCACVCVWTSLFLSLFLSHSLSYFFFPARFVLYFWGEGGIPTPSQTVSERWCIFYDDSGTTHTHTHTHVKKSTVNKKLKRRREREIQRKKEREIDREIDK